MLRPLRWLSCFLVAVCGTRYTRLFVPHTRNVITFWPFRIDVRRMGYEQNKSEKMGLIFS